MLYLINKLDVCIAIKKSQFLQLFLYSFWQEKIFYKFTYFLQHILDRRFSQIILYIFG